MLAKITFNVFITLFLCSSTFQTNGFKEEQLKFPRVKTAYKENHDFAENLLKKSGKIFLRAFKEEGVLELWATNKNSEKFELVKSYKFCVLSGKLGPKRKEGDGQVPEGFYTINRFNPSSNFYLSLGVNYPNAADRILGNKQKLGGDIFIHGNCVSIGCIPITDEKIKELYITCVLSKSNGQAEIPVHIFPFKFTPENMVRHNSDKAHIDFWNNLKDGYDHFEKTKLLPKIKVNSTGKYQIS